MNFRRRLEINWWVWALVSAPWILVALFHRWEDKAGGVWSDWSDAVYRIQHGEWRYLSETAFWDLLIPLLAGWIAQYFITMIWQWIRRDRLPNKTLQRTGAGRFIL